ncbi:FAD-binding protein [Sulfitobacter sp. F26169L]|uniref:D-arabinono-1,4-lactone oxidase n=1 Tax=Sulfitobacter sp. F26169L TaxID=2996015 RepID=UPI00226093B5|nr:D-arabinono-1,4-lactone oxidase [Sulfitobacter sp. F26169L]MCX7568183.1 FAD-binding protein [Sulfitobacter sp. F26169L]
MAETETTTRPKTASPHPGGPHQWSNWSGSVTARPAQILRPECENELRKGVAASQGKLRMCGAGHSFTALAATDGTLISLDNMQGEVLDQRRDTSGAVARLQAGASLNSLSKALLAQGLAFKNLGDIDVQSLAGAAMTATHGTGQDLPCVAGEMRSVRLLTAGADVIEADDTSDRDLLDAARVSLGALGILTQTGLSVRPAFKLHRKSTVRKLADIMAQADDLWDRHRNFEFFVLPFCDYALQLTHDETTRPDMRKGASNDEASLRDLRLLRTATKRLPKLRRRLLNTFLGKTKDEEQIGTSFDLLASVRKTVFNEMEYHMPVKGAMDVLAEVLHVIERTRPDVFFPIEVRKTAADTGWLSPFEGAPLISIAVHAHQPDDYMWFFELIEPVFRRHGGRPHWGKLHSLGARDLAELYPRFGEFRKLRAELDPKGRFINPHLAKILDVSAH